MNRIRWLIIVAVQVCMRFDQNVTPRGAKADLWELVNELFGGTLRAQNQRCQNDRRISLKRRIEENKT